MSDPHTKVTQEASEKPQPSSEQHKEPRAESMSVLFRRLYGLPPKKKQSQQR